MMKLKSKKSSGVEFDRDTISMVETNIDDVTGEVLSRAVDRLLSEGAFDATMTPFIGKKGRPGITLKVTCRKDSVEKFAQILTAETGTLGVKIIDYERLIVPRLTREIEITVNSKSYKIPVKFASTEGSSRVKIEFTEATKIADKEGIPLRTVLDIATAEAMKEIEW